MRLVNTTTIEVERFTGKAPAYAILSHRWEEEEVTLEDMKGGGSSLGMKGYRKLRLSCAVAARDGLKHIWIDTCCIDKTSSAELSEAINSMFRYYKEAAVCYTYLSDVDAVNILAGGKEAFENSSWFTRGWTLQELIAPKYMLFYNKDWDFLGTKADLTTPLETITKIPKRILLGGDLTGEPICRKMSWASSRQTTVPEDLAYCLLGIFGVNMPLLYGEGEEAAFLRLQEAILKVSDDESIFLWRTTEKEAVDEPFWGLLAKSPTYFSRSPDVPFPCTTAMTEGTPATLTGRGLNVELLMARIRADKSDSIFSALIYEDGGRRAHGIVLQKLSFSGSHFARVGADVLLEIGSELEIYESMLPTRVLSRWKVADSSAEVGKLRTFIPSALKLPNALRFYVRQNPKTSSVISKEAVGFSLSPRISLPPGLSVDDWSSGWNRWESAPAGLKNSGPIFLLNFDADSFSHYKNRLSGHVWKPWLYGVGGQEWDSQLLGVFQLSRQLLDDGSAEMILLVGLEKTSQNSLDTPLSCHRPWSALFETSELWRQLYAMSTPLSFTMSPDKTFKEILDRTDRLHYSSTIGLSTLAVSFDLQLRYGQAYYLIRVTEEEIEISSPARRANAECGSSRV